MKICLYFVVGSLGGLCLLINVGVGYIVWACAKEAIQNSKERSINVVLFFGLLLGGILFDSGVLYAFLWYSQPTLF